MILLWHSLSISKQNLSLQIWFLLRSALIPSTIMHLHHCVNSWNSLLFAFAISHFRSLVAFILACHCWKNKWKNDTCAFCLYRSVDECNAVRKRYEKSYKTEMKWLTMVIQLYDISRNTNALTKLSFSWWGMNFGRSNSLWFRFYMLTIIASANWR